MAFNTFIMDLLCLWVNEIDTGPNDLPYLLSSDCQAPHRRGVPIRKLAMQ